MITQYITQVSASFSPFARAGKTARIFLARLPANARATMAVDVKLLPRAQASTAPASLALTFKDGKTMAIDLEKVKMREIETEVDRHSRLLRRKEELAG